VKFYRLCRRRAPGKALAQATGALDEQYDDGDHAQVFDQREEDETAPPFAPPFAVAAVRAAAPIAFEAVMELTLLPAG